MTTLAIGPVSNVTETNAVKKKNCDGVEKGQL